MKTWKPFPSENCIYCGDEAEVLTDSTIAGTAYDGDTARCVACHCPGQVIVDEVLYDDESNVARIEWHDEPNCNCDWCRTHPLDVIRAES